MTYEIKDEQPTKSDDEDIKFVILKDQEIDPEIHYDIAVILHDHGDEIAYPEVFRHLKFASDKGHADATAHLADCYYSGMSVEKDVPRAVKLSIRSAEMGSLYGCYFAGKELLRGANIEPDYPLAYRYLKVAADSGDRRAINALGIMYIYGYHVKRNFRKAKRLFKKAAKMGEKIATHNLEYLCSQGKGYDPEGTPILEMTDGRGGVE